MLLFFNFNINYLANSIMSKNSSRPSRIKVPPAQPANQLELNSGETQKLGRGKGRIGKSQLYPSYAKLLVSFVNRTNACYRLQNESVDLGKSLQNMVPKNQKKIFPNKHNSDSLAAPDKNNEATPPTDSTIKVHKTLKRLERQKSTRSIQPPKTKPIHKQKMPTPQQIQRNPEPSGNPFKRSTYHIAIAYTIYQRNIKQKLCEIQNLQMQDLQVLDPTYFANKLKREQMQEV